MTDLLWMPTLALSPVLRAGLVVDRCAALAQFTETPGSITRTFLSPPMHEVHRVLRQWMKALGMTSSVDAMGNLRGVFSGNSRRRLVIGSHLDTVPNAGAYDGILGVVLGLTLIEALDNQKLAFDIEVIGFSEEEGVRFGVPFLGSRAFAGTFPPEWLDLADKRGVTVRQAIAAFGLDPAHIPTAAFDKSTFAYLEFHIEQGPVLESLHLPLSAVEGIVGQSRLRLRFEGQANHAGTTPMDLRKDALAGASQWIGAVERLGRSTLGSVATVGRVEVTPGAGNVVPGAVDASLDVRHADDAIRKDAARALLESAERIAQSRGLQLHAEHLLDQASVPCDPRLTGLLRRSMVAAGYPEHSMMSGAGHDAMVLAAHIPSTMLFLRSPGGISHHPDESVSADDVAAAIETGLQFFAELEKEL